MKNVKYTSLDRIFSKIVRDLGVTDVNESDIIEWSGEALEAIGAVTMYEESVAFIEVNNHQCLVPEGLHSIIQIARNYRYDPHKKDANSFCPKTVSKELEEHRRLNPCNHPDTSDCNCGTIDFVPLDCSGKPLVMYDIAYYRPYFDLRYEHFSWKDSAYYRGNYRPVRLGNSSFYDNLVCQENDYSQYTGIEDEYTIVQGKTLRFSFREGSIAISYLKQVMDRETGYPLVPDTYSHTTAITKYITYKLMERDFYQNREGSQARVQKAEADWQWYCKQAGNLSMMPNGIDEHQNLLEQRLYMLPRLRQYYSFFGNLNKSEHRVWNDPDRRNNNNIY